MHLQPTLATEIAGMIRWMDGYALVKTFFFKDGEAFSMCSCIKVRFFLSERAFPLMSLQF